MEVGIRKWKAIWESMTGGLYKTGERGVRNIISVRGMWEAEVYEISKIGRFRREGWIKNYVWNETRYSEWDGWKKEGSE